MTTVTFFSKQHTGSGNENLWDRDRCLTESTVAARRINNALVCFGYTLGSVAKDGSVRDFVEVILNVETDLPTGIYIFSSNFCRNILASYSYWKQQTKSSLYRIR